MDAGDELTKAVEALGSALDRPNLEPDPKRSDWEPEAEALSALRRQVREDVLAPFAAGIEALDDLEPAHRERLRNHTAQLVAEAAAALHASGRRDAAAELLRAALDLEPTDATREELEAAERDPGGYTLLVLGRWHLRTGDMRKGDRVLSRSRRATRERALRRIMDKALNGPRPLTSGAPQLFRINGCGFGLYGSRDPWDNGSHVSTYCACLLFIPVFPLTAYRVINHGRSYTFLAKERLSPFARGYRVLVVAAIALAILGGAATSYLHSPSRLARVALDDAAEVEQAGHADEALRRYQRVVDEHPQADGDTTRAAAVGIVRVLIDRVEEPMTNARVDEAARIVRRYEALPSNARGGEAASLLATRLEAWAGELGDAPADRRAALRLVELGTSVAQGADRERLEASAAQLHTELARGLREDWPVEALHHYVGAGTPDALHEATAIVTSLDASLLEDADADVRRWRERATDAPEADAHVAELRRTLADWELDVNRAQALQTGDVEALAILHDERPDDQDASAELADARRGSGDVEAALALLTAYGHPGRLNARAQRALADCYVEQDRLEDADALLTRQVEAHLPALLSAQRAYDEAALRRSETLIANARAGLEPELERQLNGVTEQAQGQAIVDTWLRARLSSDAELASLRDAYMRESGVVPTVLTLGTIKLRRAQEATGDERAAMLSESERLFLAIRDEAEGVPAFHMSLGQVYHRLGRTEEGERELRGVLEAHDPMTSLQVGQTYRQLGLERRAREVAEDVYRQTQSATGEEAAVRSGAAMLLAVLSDELEDEETWLARASQDDPEVRIRLVSVRARRAARAGDLREADRLLADVVRHYDQNAESNPVAANNAAVAHEQRYLCTGDVQQLDQASRLLERSLRLEPDSALVVGNLAEQSAYRGQVRTLNRWVRTSVLRMGPGDAQSLLSVLREGPMAEQVRAALRDDPGLRRSRELTRQEEVLAPQRPRAWQREKAWDAAANDDGALAALLARVRAVESLDTSAQTAERERARNPETRARRRADIDAAVTTAERVLRDAEQRNHPATAAAARFMLANALLGRAYGYEVLEDAQRALDLARRARASWDAIGGEQVVGALLVVAILETQASSPALRAAFDENRELSPSLVMREAVAQDPSLSARLRALPEVHEAAQIRAQTAREELGIDDVVLADISGHEELRRAAAPCLTRPDLQHSLELSALLTPGDPGTAARRAVLDSAR